MKESNNNNKPFLVSLGALVVSLGALLFTFFVHHDNNKEIIVGSFKIDKLVKDTYYGSINLEEYFYKNDTLIKYWENDSTRKKIRRNTDYTDVRAHKEILLFKTYLSLELTNHSKRNIYIKSITDNQLLGLNIKNDNSRFLDTPNALFVFNYKDSIIEFPIELKPFEVRRLIVSSYIPFKYSNEKQRVNFENLEFYPEIFSDIYKILLTKSMKIKTSMNNSFYINAELLNYSYYDEADFFDIRLLANEKTDTKILYK